MALEFIADTAERIGTGIRTAASDSYKVADALVYGYLPRGATPAEASRVLEYAARTGAKTVGADPQGRLVDTSVGLTRVVTRTTGAENPLVWNRDGTPAWQPGNRNPSYRGVDERSFDGWLPGGSRNPIHRAYDEHKDDVKDALGFGAVALAAVAAIALARKA